MSQLEITSNPHKFVQNIINSNSLQNDSSLVLDNLVEINQDSPSTAELADHDSGLYFNFLCFDHILVLLHSLL